MAESRHPTWELYYAAERDARALVAKLTELGRSLSQMDLPDPTNVACPVCGLQCKGPKTLAEHLYVSHEGTLPPQWEQADRLAG